MDQFKLLSLEDSDDNRDLDSDIWNLSLNDQKHDIANINNTLNNIVDTQNDDTQDVDINSTTSESIHDVDMVDIQENAITPYVSHDTISDIESIDSNNNIDNDKSPTTSKLSLLSPTQLGASLVIDNILPKHNTPQNQSIIRQNDIWKQLLTDKQLINVNINNHNYFNTNDQDNNLILEKEEEEEEENILPLPWSSISTPHFKKWYDSISYIQWLLNAFSILLIIYLLISSMSKDLKSIWYQNKLALINESQNCQLQYNLNHCDINFNLPEMSTICQDWWICSHRDNNKLINNRTNLLIKFLTSLINEFINELNWKTLFVSIILILGWFFISNFTMGFIRAKTYYGSGKIKDR